MWRLLNIVACTLVLGAPLVLMSGDAEATFAEDRCRELGGKVVTIRGEGGTVIYRGCCFDGGRTCDDITNLPRKSLKRQ
jgi:hypothetical protein